MGYRIQLLGDSRPCRIQMRICPLIAFSAFRVSVPAHRNFVHLGPCLSTQLLRVKSDVSLGPG